MIFQEQDNRLCVSKREALMLISALVELLDARERGNVALQTVVKPIIYTKDDQDFPGVLRITLD